MKKDIDMASVSSEKGLDMLGEMMPHLEAILKDPEYIQLKERMQADKELAAKDIMGEAFKVIAMKNRQALYGIVSAATGKTEKQVKEQPIEETLAVLEGATGNAVLNFFTFFARMAVRL